jgi:hypothetical protein
MLQRAHAGKSQTFFDRSEKRQISKKTSPETMERRISPEDRHAA